MKKKCYISGAIAHHDREERKRAFRSAANYLELKGFKAVNPFDNGQPQLADESNWRQHMRVDIGMLLQCDYIYMLRGWEQSKGSRLELDVAVSCGIEVLYEVTGVSGS